MLTSIYLPLRGSEEGEERTSWQRPLQLRRKPTEGGDPRAQHVRPREQRGGCHCEQEENAEKCAGGREARGKCRGKEDWGVDSSSTNASGSGMALGAHPSAAKKPRKALILCAPAVEELLCHVLSSLTLPVTMCLCVGLSSVFPIRLPPHTLPSTLKKPV